MMDENKVLRAITNMEAVKVRLVTKLASSTTGAQAHIGLMTQCNTDLEALRKLLPAETPTKAKRGYNAKVPEVNEEG